MATGSEGVGIPLLDRRSAARQTHTGGQRSESAYDETASKDLMGCACQPFPLDPFEAVFAVRSQLDNLSRVLPLSCRATMRRLA